MNNKESSKLLQSQFRSNEDEKMFIDTFHLTMKQPLKVPVELLSIEELQKFMSKLSKIKKYAKKQYKKRVNDLLKQVQNPKDMKSKTTAERFATKNMKENSASGSEESICAEDNQNNVSPGAKEQPSKNYTWLNIFIDFNFNG